MINEYSPERRQGICLFWQILKGKFLKSLARQVANITCPAEENCLLLNLTNVSLNLQLDVKAEDV